jgi:hypothetical protein
LRNAQHNSFKKKCSFLPGPGRGSQQAPCPRIPGVINPSDVKCLIISSEKNAYFFSEEIMRHASFLTRILVLLFLLKSNKIFLIYSENAEISIGFYF